MKLTVTINLPNVALESKWCNTDKKECVKFDMVEGKCKLFDVYLKLDKHQIDYDHIVKCSSCIKACVATSKAQDYIPVHQGNWHKGP